jgi:hypothetical protein
MFQYNFYISQDVKTNHAVLSLKKPLICRLVFK